MTCTSLSHKTSVYNTFIRTLFRTPQPSGMLVQNQRIPSSIIPTRVQSLLGFPQDNKQLHLTTQEEIKQSLTLRLFISRAWVRRPSSFSPVPILLCNKCSFSSNLRTTCSWASTLERERGGTEGLKFMLCRSSELSLKLHAKTISASPQSRTTSSVCLFPPEHTSSLRAVSRALR